MSAVDPEIEKGGGGGECNPHYLPSASTNACCEALGKN